MSSLQDLISMPCDYREKLSELSRKIDPESPLLKLISEKPDVEFTESEEDDNYSDSQAFNNLFGDPDDESQEDNRSITKEKRVNLKPKYRLRKIEVIDDKEGKKRIIAIPDYLTQTLMKSIHGSLNEVLRSIPEDCTFNQERFKLLLPYHGKETFYSIDLKSATELMPVD